MDIKIKIAVCDDTKKDMDILVDFLDDYAYKKKIDMEVETFLSGNDLIERYESNPAFDLLFFDVEMPVQSGIDVAHIVKTKFDNSVKVVFVSNYPKYMQDSFKVHPYHFLQKPVNEAMIEKLMDDFIRDYALSGTFVTVIDEFGKNFTVNIDDIYYIETFDAKKRMLTFVCKDRKIEARGVLNDWYDKLKDFAFHVLSRSTIVNLSHIHCISEEEILLDNGEKLWASRKYKKILLDNYLNQIVAIKRGGLLK